MRKPSFLVRLKGEGKIKLIETSDEIAESYVQKSDKSIRSSKAVAEIENYEDSVALAYYSMYYSLLALLFKVGIKCENHTGAIILLKEVFEKDNKVISHAKKERVDKQYYVDFSVTKEEVYEMIELAEEFNGEMHHFIESFTSAKIEEYRKRAQEILR